MELLLVFMPSKSDFLVVMKGEMEDEWWDGVRKAASDAVSSPSAATAAVSPIEQKLFFWNMMDNDLIGY